MSDDQVIDPMDWLNDLAVKQQRAAVRWRRVLTIALGVDTALLTVTLVLLRLAGVM
jgi:hypothetical protein